MLNFTGEDACATLQKLTPPVRGGNFLP